MANRKLRYPPRPSALLERRIRHQFGLSESLARLITDLHWGAIHERHRLSARPLR